MGTSPRLHRRAAALPHEDPAHDPGRRSRSRGRHARRRSCNGSVRDRALATHQRFFSNLFYEQPLLAAIRRPGQVRSLSLISPSGIGRQNTALLMKAAILLQLGEWGRRRALRLVSGSEQVPQGVAEFAVAIFRHFRPRLERLPLRTDEELAALAIPVQLILGATDRMIQSADTRDRMERLVKDLHVTWLENEGHMLGSQAPRLLDFLGTLARSRVPSTESRHDPVARPCSIAQ